MPSATRPPLTSSSAKPTTRPGTSPDASQSSASARPRAVARLQEVRGEHEQSVGRLLEGGEGRLGQLQRTRVVPLLRLRAGEGDPGRRIRRVQLEDAAEHGRASRPFPEACRPGEVQLRAEQARLQPDGLLEELGALRRAGPAERGWRPAPNRPRLASRDRRARAAPAGRLPGAALPGPGRPPSGGPPAPGAPKAAPAARPHRSRASARLALGSAPPGRPAGLPGRADVGSRVPTCDTTTTISSRAASRTGPIAAGCTAC